MTVATKKPGRPVSEPTKPAMIRLTEAQRVKYLELGGARWIKRLIQSEIDKSSSPKSSSIDFSEGELDELVREMSMEKDVGLCRPG